MSGAIREGAVGYDRTWLGASVGEVKEVSGGDE